MADQTTETVNQQKQETITKQKNPLRVEQGKRLAEYNRCKKEELKHLNERITKQGDMIEHKPKEPSNKYLYISRVGVVGLAIIGYLLYNKFKKPEQNLIDLPSPANVSHANIKIEPKRDTFETLKNFCHIYIYTHMVVENYAKDLKESVYYGAVVSALAVGFTVLGKSLIKMSPPSLGKLDVEDGAKLVAIVAISDFTKDYLIKQKIIPDSI